MILENAISDTVTNIIVLGDLHGHLTLAYTLIRKWEIEHGKKIDLILQVGDLGAYPPPFQLDPSTQRFAKRDPDELGFAHYYEESEEADMFLASDAPDKTRVSAKLFFIKGNHEDFGFLEGITDYADQPGFVDAYGKIHYLRSGQVYPITAGIEELTVGVLGGIERGHSGKQTIDERMFFTESEINHLLSYDGNLDILLTHDFPYGTITPGNSGSREVSQLIEVLKPDFHFCGHCHVDGAQLPSPADSQSYVLNEVNFRRRHQLNLGCFGVLEIKNGRERSFTIVDDDWLSEFQRDTFREV